MPAVGHHDRADRGQHRVRARPARPARHRWAAAGRRREPRTGSSPRRRRRCARRPADRPTWSSPAPAAGRARPARPAGNRRPAARTRTGAGAAAGDAGSTTSSGAERGVARRDRPAWSGRRRRDQHHHAAGRQRRVDREPAVDPGRGQFGGRRPARPRRRRPGRSARRRRRAGPARRRCCRRPRRVTVTWAGCRAPKTTGAGELAHHVQADVADHRDLRPGAGSCRPSHATAGAPASATATSRPVRRSPAPGRRSPAGSRRGSPRGSTPAAAG